MATKLIPLFALALAAACDDGPTAVTNGVVTVVREGDAVRITNGTNQARAYSAYDANWLAVANVSDLSLLALCYTTDATCLRLPAHGTVLVPFSEVGGYSASTKEIAVWTWRVVPSSTGGGLEALPDDSVLLNL